MPAVSQKQQQFFAICEHEPGKAKGKCPNMSKKQMHDFASTPRKGLPPKAAAQGYYKAAMR